MGDHQFTASTDKEEKFKLDSNLIYATWTSAVAHGGQTAPLEVATAFVGQGAGIKIKGRSEKGKKLGEIDGVVKNNNFKGRFEIPEDIELGDEIYFEVELPKNKIKGESNRIPAFPPVRVSNLKWSAEKVRRGDLVVLSADLEGVREEAEVSVTVYENLADRAREKIVEFPATVQNKKIEVTWEFEYFESTLGIPTEKEQQESDQKLHYVHPEYFFTLKVGSEEYGRDRESGLLRFRDELEFTLVDEDGTPFASEDYVLLLADGNERKGTLDPDGHALETDLPPGEVMILLPERGEVFGS